MVHHNYFWDDTSSDKNKVCRISSWPVNNKPEKLGGSLNDFQPHRWYSSFIEQCSLWQSSQGIQRLLEEFAAKICIVSCKTHLLFYKQPHNTKPKQLKAKHEGKRKIYMIFVHTIFSCFPKSGTKMQLMHISIWHIYCGFTQIWSKPDFPIRLYSSNRRCELLIHHLLIFKCLTSGIPTLHAFTESNLQASSNQSD